MKLISPLNLLLGAMLLNTGIAQANVVATFDDLPLPPELTSSSGLQYTNDNNSLSYRGTIWDDRFSVVGDQYRVSPLDGPLFGLPHSGHYFVTNQDGQSGLLITTPNILTGAWFGRNEYYGFGAGGADQITIFALSGATELASVVFDLPETADGEPEVLSFVDTGIFQTLTGISAYRIDRRELGTQSGHWVADDFQFISTSEVPLPMSLNLMALVIGLWWAQTGRRHASGHAGRNNT